MRKPVPGSREAANENAKAAHDAIVTLVAALAELEILPAEHAMEVLERVIEPFPPARQASARIEVREALGDFDALDVGE